MADQAGISQELLLRMTTDVASAYVSHNPVPAAELSETIRMIGKQFAELGSGQATRPAEARVPAVPIKQSVKPGHIVCLDCGKRFKSIKRHFRTAHGLTPDEYVARWSLPRDYPLLGGVLGNSFQDGQGNWIGPGPEEARWPAHCEERIETTHPVPPALHTRRRESGAPFAAPSGAAGVAAHLRTGWCASAAQHVTLVGIVL